jgi:hypothetical protein
MGKSVVNKKLSLPTFIQCSKIEVKGTSKASNKEILVFADSVQISQNYVSMK